MGLDCSHGFWNGPYSQFMAWRRWLAAQIGLPLGLMDGFYGWEWGDSELSFEDDWTSLYKLSGNTTLMWDTLKAVECTGKAIPWSITNDPLRILLSHSDCAGRIRWWDCKPIALRLSQIVRESDDDFHAPVFVAGGRVGSLMWSRWQDGRGCYDGMVPATKRAAVGCLRAWKERKDIRFR